MILKYFLPDKDFSWEELGQMSGKEPNGATWPFQMLINLSRANFDIAVIDNFNEKEFIQNGETYLKRQFGEEGGKWQAAHCDVQKVRAQCKDFLNSGIMKQQRLASVDDIRKFLGMGYLINSVVNSKALNNEKGYTGHSVLIYKIDDKTITFHDPGLPAKEARRITIDKFIEAWNGNNNVIAVTYKG